MVTSGSKLVGCLLMDLSTILSLISRLESGADLGFIKGGGGGANSRY